MKMQEIDNTQMTKNECWINLDPRDLHHNVQEGSREIIGGVRTLIPFMEHGKYGFINRMGEIVVTPEYDIYEEQFNCILVGKFDCYGYYPQDYEPYPKYKWGVIDMTGRIIIEPKYYKITPLSYGFIAKAKYNSCCLFGASGNVLVPEGKYSFIDCFEYDYARVNVCKYDNGKLVKKWGIIDGSGYEVLPTEYDSIWNFKGKNVPSTKIIKGDEVSYFRLTNFY